MILSPRDVEIAQLSGFGADIVHLGGRVLFDPQMYVPGSNHPRLVRQPYWVETLDAENAESVIQSLININDSVHADRFIIPGTLCSRVNASWLENQKVLVDAASNLLPGVRRLATICLSGEVLRFEEQIENLLNAMEDWQIDGVYVIPQPPSNGYFVEDITWLGNLLVFCAGLKLRQKEVIVGYCNHQMLCLAASNVNAISSGTWLNVRSFSTQKFHENASDTRRNRAVWYYCPQSLSEYKITFLDLAYRSEILESLRSRDELESNYADKLFRGAQPTSTDYGEPESFRHYLQCLWKQCQLASFSSYTEAQHHQETLLKEAKEAGKYLNRNGIYGQQRDFIDVVDINAGALIILQKARGLMLTHFWDN